MDAELMAAYERVGPQCRTRLEQPVLDHSDLVAEFMDAKAGRGLFRWGWSSTGPEGNFLYELCRLEGRARELGAESWRRGDGWDFNEVPDLEPQLSRFGLQPDPRSERCSDRFEFSWPRSQSGHWIRDIVIHRWNTWDEAVMWAVGWSLAPASSRGPPKVSELQISGNAPGTVKIVEPPYSGASDPVSKFMLVYSNLTVSGEIPAELFEVFLSVFHEAMKDPEIVHRCHESWSPIEQSELELDPIEPRIPKSLEEAQRIDPAVRVALDDLSPDKREVLQNPLLDHQDRFDRYLAQGYDEERLVWARSLLEQVWREEFRARDLRFDQWPSTHLPHVSELETLLPSVLSLGMKRMGGGGGSSRAATYWATDRGTRSTRPTVSMQVHGSWKEAANAIVRRSMTKRFDREVSEYQVKVHPSGAVIVLENGESLNPDRSHRFLVLYGNVTIDGLLERDQLNNLLDSLIEAAGR